MAEKIISPGVFTRENDLSFVQQGVGAIGAAIVGPTVKGPAMIPTKVWSYTEYQALFGDSFKSGSDYFQYFTSITAKEYLKHGGPLTVCRVLAGGDYLPATASAHMAKAATPLVSPAIFTWSLADGAMVESYNLDDGALIQYTASNGTAYLFQAESGVIPANNPTAPTNALGTTTGIYYFGIGNKFDTNGGQALHSTANNFYAGNTGSGGASFNSITGDTLTSWSFDTTQPIVAWQITGSSTATSNITVVSGSTATSASVAGTYPANTSVAYVAEIGGITVMNELGGGNAPLSGVPKALNNLGTATTWDTFTASFHIKTIGDGTVMNSTPQTAAGVVGVGKNDLLTTGSVKYGTKDNLRWEVSNISQTKGTFTVLIRRGDDTSKRKVILETWNGCSLDPGANNYIGNVIGTQYNTCDQSGTTPFIQPFGSYPNRSKYVYIPEDTVLQTVDYLDDNGELVDDAATGSLPMISSGSFGGGHNGDEAVHPHNFYDKVDVSDCQGLNLTLLQSGNLSYLNAISLLSNADEYDINLLMAPGVNDNQHNNITEHMLTTCEERGDMMCIIDPVPHGMALANAVTEASDKDSSYGAMYWPWVQIADSQTGRYVWVPQSAVMPGIYAFNDKVSAEWFAPAGLNRGGQEIVVQAERKLAHADRDTLYEANVNPIATFPGEGVVVWGQKTLQKKASALDRVNVRRLLINLKKFIASVSKYLIFENNTATTRNRFLSQVNPYMESVQQRQGLYAFKVVMDESNNTPDVIDRNIMKGDIFIQPAKAAEFIVIDFNIMPTGATFND